MTTFFLPADMQATVTPAALSSGSLVRLSDSPGGEPYAPVALSASTPVTVGPFATPRRYRINTTQGSISYSIAAVSEVDQSTVAITGGTISGVTQTGGTSTAKAVVTEYVSDGAVAISDGVAVLTKPTAGAYTLAAPTAAQEGTVLTITSGTAAAHVVVATDLLNDGVTGGAKDEATFAAFVGASITLVAYNLEWNVLSTHNVTVAAAA